MLILSYVIFEMFSEAINDIFSNTCRILLSCVLFSLKLVQVEHNEQWLIFQVENQFFNQVLLCKR